MYNYKTKLPGIDRSSNKNKMGRANSSALQMGTREYTAVAGSSPTNFGPIATIKGAAKGIGGLMSGGSLKDAAKSVLGGMFMKRGNAGCKCGTSDCKC